MQSHILGVHVIVQEYNHMLRFWNIFLYDVIFIRWSNDVALFFDFFFERLMILLVRRLFPGGYVIWPQRGMNLNSLDFSWDPLKLNKWWSDELIGSLSLASATPLVYLLCIFSASVKSKGETTTFWLSFWFMLDVTVLNFKQLEYWTRDNPKEVLILTIKQLNKQSLNNCTSENEYTSISNGTAGC